MLHSLTSDLHPFDFEASSTLFPSSTGFWLIEVSWCNGSYSASLTKFEKAYVWFCIRRAFRYLNLRNILRHQRPRKITRSFLCLSLLASQSYKMLLVLLCVLFQGHLLSLLSSSEHCMSLKPTIWPTGKGGTAMPLHSHEHLEGRLIARCMPSVYLPQLS